MTEYVVVGRTESIPGEFANVHAEVLVELKPGEDHEAALLRASRIVRDGIRDEVRRRRATQSSLDSWIEDQEANA